MEFKGTKEKWSFDGKEKWFEGVRCFEVHFGDDGECIAEIVHEAHDALLISKAPELLNCLQVLCDLKRIKELDGETPYYLEEKPKAWEKALALIKQSTEL